MLHQYYPPLIPPDLGGMPTCCDERQHGERQGVLSLPNTYASYLIAVVIVQII